MAAMGNSNFWLVWQVSDTGSAHWASAVCMCPLYLSCFLYIVLYYMYANVIPYASDVFDTIFKKNLVLRDFVCEILSCLAVIWLLNWQVCVIKPSALTKHTTMMQNIYLSYICMFNDITDIFICGTSVWQSTFVKAEYIIKVMTSAVKDKWGVGSSLNLSPIKAPIQYQRKPLNMYW